MPVDPWQRAEAGSEHSHQVALCMWANMAATFGLGLANEPRAYSEKGFALSSTATRVLQPDLKWLHAVKNQGHGDAVRGNRSAAEGVKAGVLDLFLPVPRYPFHGLYIEMKHERYRHTDDGGMKPEQIKFTNFVCGKGYIVRIAYNWLEGRYHILKYMGIVI